ncbi:hypothetical protein E5Q_01300 [Mixia osmundae IAM 14324]|uniref:Uncharacterized protein n=1 Tax=Mixia osmundae (strain CBS 9802 / IAM 14324 / JCM 22182 / KY 12970) TaxID=764103 RepID=G7DVN7_MIXOS|nr:hypothetical protein E5Q_01300 [Mixia osmundae IAM 14324]
MYDYLAAVCWPIIQTGVKPLDRYCSMHYCLDLRLSYLSGRHDPHVERKYFNVICQSDSDVDAPLFPRTPTPLECECGHHGCDTPNNVCLNDRKLNCCALPAEHDWALTFSSPGNDAWTLYFSLAWDPATKSYNKLNYFLPSHGGAAHYRGSGFNQQTPESTWTFERGNIYAITLVVRYAQDDGTVVKYSVISGGFNGEDFNHTDLTIDGVVISKL